MTPDIIYIGYMKAASTFIRQYFTLHPEISWTRNAWVFQIPVNIKSKAKAYSRFSKNIKKEACHIDMFEGLSVGLYFDIEISGHQHEIESQVDSGKIIIPDMNEIINSIKHILPNTKILIVIRNQIDWIRSMYLYYKHHLPEGQNSFQDFMKTTVAQRDISAVFYHTTIKAYMDNFPGKVKVMVMEQLEKEPDIFFRDLCGFFGVIYNPIIPTEKEHFNESIEFFKMDKKVVQVISDSYAKSNSITANLIQKNLKVYGYPV